MNVIPAVRCAVLSIIFVCAACPVADAEGEGQNQRSQPSNPAPPLFPKHRRGIYKDSQGMEVIDATPQSPPLDLDDPGVPAKGEYEINLSTEADCSEGERRFDLVHIDANYGLLLKIAGYELPTQLKVEFPVAAAKEDGSPFTVGVGAAIVGFKFNFYTDENRGVSVSFYPQIEFEAPGSHGVEKDLAEPGQTLILPLLVSKEFKYFTGVANGAVQQPIHDPERGTTGILGLGLGRAITRKLAAMTALSVESNFDLKRDRLVLLDAGLIYGVRNVIAYTQLGHSLYADHGVSRLHVGVGIKVFIHPSERK